MPREGVAVALGAQAEHLLTHRASPEGFLIYTVFAKKCQKRSKKGVPPILTTFWEGFTLLWAPHLGLGSRTSILSPLSHPKGTKSALGAEISRWGVLGG